MKELRISSDLSLPIDAVTQAIGWLGRRGSGKTYGATKLAELMLDAGAQIIALDPVGVWNGLRQGNGFDIPVLGGLRGDIPLEPTGGKLVADLIVSRGISAVLDVSQMISSDQARFAHGFAAQFFERKKASPSAVHLFLEECQEFVPENPQRGGLEPKMLHEFQRIVKLGRNFGIGVSLISQRPQEVSKKALNQTELLFAFQMTGPQERKTVQGWTSEKGVDENVYELLPRLKVGEPRAWSMQWLGVTKTIRIAPKRSLDASSTPKVGAKATPVKPLTPIDLADLRGAMSETIERAKQDDPKELRREIAELKKQVNGRAAAPPERVVVEVPVLTDAERAELGEMRSALFTFGAQLEQLSGQLGARLVPRETPPARNAAPKPLIPGRPVLKRRDPPVAAQKISHSDNGAKLDKCAMAILRACKQRHPKTTSASQAAVLGGYRLSGSFNAALADLREKGLLSGPGSAMVTTPSGLHEAGDVPPMPYGEELLDYWVQKSTPCEGAILRVLFEAGSAGAFADQLADATNYKQSGSFNAALAKMRKIELIQKGSPIRIHPMFLE